MGEKKEEFIIAYLKFRKEWSEKLGGGLTGLTSINCYQKEGELIERKIIGDDIEAELDSAIEQVVLDLVGEGE